MSIFDNHFIIYFNFYYVFKTFGQVRDKSVTVAPTRMYRCNQCLEQFAKLGDFRVHVCLQGNNRCDQCEQTFATVKALQLHMKVHENSEFPSQKIFLCTVCGTEFLTHKSLRLHSRMHLPVKARHVDAPEGTEEETFDCSECGKYNFKFTYHLLLLFFFFIELLYTKLHH